MRTEGDSGGVEHDKVYFFWIIISPVLVLLDFLFCQSADCYAVYWDGYFVFDLVIGGKFMCEVTG